MTHNITDRSNLGPNYEVFNFILMNSTPRSLEENEHNFNFIQKLRTIKPHGINSVDPFGIPLLLKIKLLTRVTRYLILYCYFFRFLVLCNTLLKATDSYC
jgi:hypothetical protein